MKGFYVQFCDWGIFIIPKLIMAIGEYEEYDARQGIIAASGPYSHDANADSDNASGQPDGRGPIQATDYFTVELPGGMDASNLAGQMLLASIGERVTSVDGSDSLDTISRATVRRSDGCLMAVPNRDISPADNLCGNQASNDVASTSSAITAPMELEHGQQTTEDSDRMLSSLQYLSANSFNNSSLDITHVPAQEETAHTGAVSYNPISDIDNRAEVVKEIHESHQVSQTFPENCQIPVSQEESSGYSSDIVTYSELEEQYKGTRVSAEQHIDRSPSRPFSAKYPPLLMSETGTNALKCLSGTQAVPLHPSYSGFPTRLQSILGVPDFVLGDGFTVNRDLLSLAGFFYSGHNTVTCFHCGCSPRVWGEGRDPNTEHRMLSPYCKAVAFSLLN